MTVVQRFVVAFMVVLAVQACSSSTPTAPTSAPPPGAPSGPPVALTIVSASPQPGTQLPRDTSISFEVTLDYDLGAHSSGDLALLMIAMGSGSQFGYLDAGLLTKLTTTRGRTTVRFGGKFEARAAGQPLRVTLSIFADGMTLTGRTLNYTIAP
jgi:hypothetical protein